MREVRWLLNLLDVDPVPCTEGAGFYLRSTIFKRYYLNFVNHITNEVILYIHFIFGMSYSISPIHSQTNKQYQCLVDVFWRS